MLFPTLDYLVFLPLCLLLYWSVPRALRLWVLLLSSAIFYASWSPLYLMVLAGMSVLAWTSGLWLGQRGGGEGGADRLSRGLVAMALIAPLLVFKYWDWTAWNVEQVMAFAGQPLSLPRVELPLPVGISFFTFQALAYAIDTGRPARAGGQAPEPNLLRFGTYLAFFPQLVAGPILRRRELLPALNELPALRDGDVGQGLFRICQGMAKKILIADTLAVGMVDPVMSDPSRFTGPEILVALYAYTIQIYYDFSAYTDIALGSARLFGFQLPENFRRPYQATCVAGFWRRWHITLSNWVRDYVYYPLGGNRVAADQQWKVYRNIMLTLLIIGVWHGASWNFVVYGILHGLAVAWCRYRRKTTGRGPDDPLPNAYAWAWRWFFTFHFVVLARVLFRSEDLGHAASIMAELLDPTLVLPRFSPTAWVVLILGFAVHMSPERWRDELGARFQRSSPLVWAATAAITAALCILLGSGDRLSFVYYQF